MTGRTAGGGLRGFDPAATMLDAARRQRDLAALAGGEAVDVLVVGGGVTGAGVALDAASRGLRVALVERCDLAAGTSRWSSKLAHGGLRYITAGQVGVAWESAVERNILARTIAPHLVRPMPFLLPMLPDYPRGSRTLSRTLFGVADVLRAASRTPTAMPRTRWADAAETRALIPTIHAGARGSYVHVDGALEDDARLVVAIARTAAGFGARIITHAEVTQVARDGAALIDRLTGERSELRARSVVVATGVWSGGLVDGVPLRPSRGAHLILRADALGRPSAAFNVMLPGSANRFVFAVPRPDGTVQVGLTDTAVEQVDDVPEVTADDERFLLETLSTGLAVPLSAGEVIGRFAGLRPLLASEAGSTADLSRHHALLERDGVLVIVGGKLTTYRRMAQDAVDRACARLGRPLACRTTRIPLVGAGSIPTGGGMPARLLRRYGVEAARVAAGGADQPSDLLEPLVAGAPALRCELEWALRAEGAASVEDVVERRLRYDLVDAWREAVTPQVQDRFTRTPSGQRM